MKELEFWKIIEDRHPALTEADVQEMGHEDAQYFSIKELLHSEERAVAFQEKLNEKILSLFEPKIAELFLVSCNPQEKYDSLYISNDGFIDFRAWIVSLGKANYERFLNFESETEILEYNLDPNFAYREDLVYLVNEVFDESFEKESPCSLEVNGDYEKLYIEIRKNNLKNIYPILFKRFSLD